MGFRHRIAPTEVPSKSTWKIRPSRARMDGGMNAISYPHQEMDHSGVVRIEGTRYKVSHLAVEHYVHGWTAEELLRQHPDLRPGQVMPH